MALYKQEKSPYWFSSITINGERIRVSTHQKDKRLAKLAENDLLSKARQQGVDTLTRKSPTLREFAPEFLAWIEATTSIVADTKRYYRTGWILLEKTDLADKNLASIKNVDCQTTSFPGAGYTANQALATLSRMFSLAEEKGRFFGKVPKIEKRKVWGRSVQMSSDNAAAIASKMKDGDPKDVLIVLRATGMRPAEAYSMRWEYIDWNTGIYANPSGKTKSAHRAIPLLDEALPVLSRRHVVQGQPRQGWVFPSDSKSGHVVSIAKAFAIARKAAGLPKAYCLYTARHGRMTDFINVMPLDAAMRYGGHTDPKVALGYQHNEVSNLQARLIEARTNGAIN
jgi:integrase